MKRPSIGPPAAMSIGAPWAILVAIISVASAATVQAQPQVPTGHVWELIQAGEAPAVGELPSQRVMNLDLVLPLRDPVGLDNLLSEIYDPTSASYGQFLTVEEFTARFGPTQADYDAVVEFAKARGLRVTGGSRDGMEVQVTGSVSTVEAAFHLSIRSYRHPFEGRAFYAPDRDPTVGLPVKLSHVSGLDNYSIPHPLFVAKSDYAVARGVDPAAAPVSNAASGSGPAGSFLGSDMRAAYYGGAALTGAGQHLGLLEFYGTNLADLNKYFKDAGEKNSVPITVLSTDGSKTSCFMSAGCDDTEQTIDLTQALGMAPGLASLVMYVGRTDTAIFSAMTTHHPLPTTIACSWMWWGDPAAVDPYFKRMAAQGQTFFAASGDQATWAPWYDPWPGDDAFVVSVGGTDLVTSGAGGRWASETAWADSGGGVSPSDIPIPAWQKGQGVITAVNAGSKKFRNGPDVSANANFTFYTCANQTACRANAYGGTSFAAPMWAGFISLVNQQRAQRGGPKVGFINPKIYTNNVTSRYATGFHDIQHGRAGDNSAVKGYDLVTGWGSPKPQLINELAP